MAEVSEQRCVDDVGGDAQQPMVGHREVADSEQPAHGEQRAGQGDAANVDESDVGIVGREHG